MFTSGFEEANPGLTEQLVMEIVEGAYQDVSEEIIYNPPPASEIYRGPYCGPVSKAMMNRFRGIGIWSEVLIGGGLIDNSPHHKFVDLGTDWIADGDWQQMLLIPNPNLPKVLICQKSYLGVTLQKLNVPKRYHYFWLTARPESDDLDLRTNLMAAPVF